MSRAHPYHFALLVCALDGLWAWQAFSAVPTNAGSNVALVSLIVWSTLHLPAGILGGLLLQPFGVLSHGAAALPSWALLFMAALGLIQSSAIAWGVAAWWQHRHRAH